MCLGAGLDLLGYVRLTCDTIDRINLFTSSFTFLALGVAAISFPHPQSSPLLDSMSFKGVLDGLPTLRQTYNLFFPDKVPPEGKDPGSAEYP